MTIRAKELKIEEKRAKQGIHSYHLHQLFRILGVMAVILIVFVFGILITGYRMIGYFTFIPRGLADYLHRIYFNVPFIVLVVAHSLLSIRVYVMRKKKGSVFLDIILAIAGVGLIAFFSYFALSTVFFFRR